MINKYQKLEFKISIILGFFLAFFYILNSSSFNHPIQISNAVIENKTFNITKEKKIFENLNCGINSIPKSTEFIKEFVIPSYCNIPIAITYDKADNKVWFISTKAGNLTNFDPSNNKFQSYKIPTWPTRDQEIGNSWSWDLKLDQSGKNLWFTDEKQSSVWKFNKDKNDFEEIKIPSTSKYYSTSYPISLAFGKENDIYLVGIRTLSIWHIDVKGSSNNTSYKVTEIPIPLNNTFKGIDEYEIGLGSMSMDSKRENIWITALAFNKKGALINYNIPTNNFKIYDLPKTITSPVGIVIDHNDDIWITDHGTSSFYKIQTKKISNHINETNIEHFITSPLSTRIFGLEYDKSLQNFSINIGNTLPYWIKVSKDNTIWFNEHVANRIAQFNSKDNKLIEYWIPTQNIYYSICKPTNNFSCGYSNALQFDIEENENKKSTSTPSKIWFTEQSENKIGFIDLLKPLPIELSFDSQIMNVSVKNKENAVVNMNISQNKLYSGNFYNDKPLILKPIIAGSFTPNGEIKKIHTIFKPDLSKFNIKEKYNNNINNNIIIKVELTNLDKVTPGSYKLMLGVETQDFSISKKIVLNISR